MERYHEIYQERQEKLNTIHLAQLRELVGLLPYAFINQVVWDSRITELERNVQKLHKLP
jgi:hypothetical protein